MIVDFDNGARALLEICMFAECSKHQEEVSLIGTHGKLEAFAPSHGVRSDDPDLVNFRRGVRNPAFVRGFDYVDPPAPEECGELIEAHEGVRTHARTQHTHVLNTRIAAGTEPSLRGVACVPQYGRWSSACWRRAIIAAPHTMNFAHSPTRRSNRAHQR